MTLLCVPITVTSLPDALAAAARASERGADIVEYRIDAFTDHPDEVVALLDGSPLPCVLTCRSAEEGGAYDGDDQTRVALLEYALTKATRPPAYLDVELATYQRSANLRQKVGLVVDHPGQVRPTSTGLILSSHDFDTRPIDLYQRVEAMAAAPACRVIKLAWRARSLRDNLEAFEIVQQNYKPTVALCMGEFGLMSRVLARKFGALLTFAALDEHTGTAPGQPTVEQLRRLYRWDRLTPATRVYGVVGYPIGHSLSPHVHNAGFDATGHDGVYLPMPIPPEYEHFKATVGSMLDTPDLHLRGLSVTIPHKENLLRFVRERGGDVEPLAVSIGAANTLTVRDDGSLHAQNTDYAAILDSVCAAMNITRDALRGLRVGVIGAGGAARSAVAGFAQHGATVVVYNRTLEKAQRLAEQFSGAHDAKVVAARLEKLCDSCCHVFVNCTPIGMHPHVDATPMPDLAQHVRDAGTPPPVVFDTIYNPVETRLLREARAAGYPTVTGVEMFVRQAAAQFETWTRGEAPSHLFRDVLVTILSARGR